MASTWLRDPASLLPLARFTQPRVRHLALDLDGVQTHARTVNATFLFQSLGRIEREKREARRGGRQRGSRGGGRGRQCADDSASSSSSEEDYDDDDDDYDDNDVEIGEPVTTEGFGARFDIRITTPQSEYSECKPEVESTKPLCG